MEEKIMATERTCSGCEYFDNFGAGYKRGWCRRYAPKVIVVGEEWETVWPTVEIEDWCGEFKPKEVA